MSAPLSSGLVDDFWGSITNACMVLGSAVVAVVMVSVVAALLLVGWMWLAADSFDEGN